MLAHMNENVIDSSGAGPATYCQTAGMWPIALFSSYMCTKIINLSENIWAGDYLMQPYNNSKHSLFSTQIKGQYVSFRPSESYYPQEIFQELKFSCENLHIFAKTHKNFTCLKLVCILFHPPALSATTPKSLSGQKMAKLMQSFCPLRSLAQSVLPISQTNASSKIMKQSQTKWPTQGKRPFLHLVLSLDQEVTIPFVFRSLPWNREKHSSFPEPWHNHRGQLNAKVQNSVQNINISCISRRKAPRPDWI